MENLDKSLSQMLEQLGIRSDSFVEWLTGTGLPSYARMQVIQHGITTVFGFVGCVICVAVTIWAIKKYNAAGYHYDSTMYFAIGLTAVIFLCILLCIVFVELTSWVNWAFNPEGALVELLLTYVG